MAKKYSTEFKVRCHAIRMVKCRAEDMLDKSVYPDGFEFGVHLVWSCYILGNMKFMLTTDIPDGKYYEVTYNFENGEFYLDEYVRTYHCCDIVE